MITPEETVYCGDADIVTMPAVVGQMGIIPAPGSLDEASGPGEIIAAQGWS